MQKREQPCTLRSARSEHILPYVGSQSARIDALLNEMKPVLRHNQTVDFLQRKSIGGSQSFAPPKYNELYCNTSSSSTHSLRPTAFPTMGTLTRRAPPDYSQLASVRPYVSQWQITASDSRPHQPGWTKHPKPLLKSAISPAGFFRSLEQKNGPLSPNGNLSVAAVKIPQGSVELVDVRTSSDSTIDSGSSQDGNEKLTSTLNLNRRTPRQASFMAAMGRAAEEEEEENEKAATDVEKTPEKSFLSETTSLSLSATPISRSSRPMSPYRRRPHNLRPKDTDYSLVKLKSVGSCEGNSGGKRQAIVQGQDNREEVEKEYRRASEQVSLSSTNVSNNFYQPAEASNDAVKMRRQRPKSYVLATSTSMQDEILTPNKKIVPESASSISHDDTTTTSGFREEGSSLIGSSLSSIDNGAVAGGGPPRSHTSRSLNAPHPPASHRLHRFIALFNYSKQDGCREAKPKMKRSRTSGPVGRSPCMTTSLRREQIIRQTWLKHQEIGLGKSGKRRQWDDRWGILSERSLHLCVQPPSFINDKVVELGEHTTVEVRGAIVDIAYDWLSQTKKQKHVVRIVASDCTEHLLEVTTEAEMLSWISALQACSDGLGTSSDTVEEVKKIIPETSPAVAAARRPLHSSYSIASLASSSCSTVASESGAKGTAKEPKEVDHYSLSGIGGGGGGDTRKEDNGEDQLRPLNSTTSQLIMHRYKAKSSQMQSPIASKKGECCATTTSANSATVTSSATSGPNSARTDTAENGEATTPKSARKWKKSKASKQGSFGSGHATGPSSSSSGSAANPQPVLGVKLADCTMANPGEMVPLLVRICVTVVEAHGMDTVGIYRIPGNTAAVNALKDSLANVGFEHVDPANMEAVDPRWRDVNVVSSLLKMFLRKLPEPLLTDKLYPFFIDANRIPNHHNRLHKLRNLLRKLPRHHYETLKFLICHLHEITRNGEINKMETRNLALMFGPSIVRPSDDNMATMVTHMSDQCKIIETLIYYNEWMFDETSTIEDAVPEQHPNEGSNSVEPASYGVSVPTGVSAASFNDMHSLIRKANEDQAAAMMNEGKTAKIKNILRRNSRRDKSKSKMKIESTAPAAVCPRQYTQPTPSTTSVESAFCGNYQERDIDAEIESRRVGATGTPPGVGSDDACSLAERIPEQGMSIDSSLGSLADAPTTSTAVGGAGEAVEEARRKRQEAMHSARRIFIAGSAAAATNEDTAAVDALANHSHHLNLASSPAFEVLSEEMREKIRRMQKKQNWHQDVAKDVKAVELLKAYSPTKDVTDALSFTSDYSTTSSAHLSSNPPLAVACVDQPNSSSDYASNDPSPCARNASSSPRNRPSALGITEGTGGEQNTAATVPLSKSQKIKMRVKAANRDPARRHTLSDVDALKGGRLDKLVKWFGLRKSSPDVSQEEQQQQKEGAEKGQKTSRRSLIVASSHNNAPPIIVKTSPNELTPVSGDEQL